MKLFTLLPCTALLPLLSAHMWMSDPPCRCSQENENTKEECGEADYNIKSPIWNETEKTSDLCRGHKAGKPVATWKAGQDVTTTISGQADHGGGWCQFSLSYDGTTFVAIETVKGGCPTTRSHTVTIPAAAKGTAVYAWTWFNAIGNREMYMNCADVEIENDTDTDGCIEGNEILVANYPGGTIISPEAIKTDASMMDQTPVQKICPTYTTAGTKEKTNGNAKQTKTGYGSGNGNATTTTSGANKQTTSNGTTAASGGQGGGQPKTSPATGNSAAVASTPASYAAVTSAAQYVPSGSSPGGYGTTSAAAPTTTSDVYGYGTTSAAAPTSDVYGYGTTSATSPTTTSDVYGYGTTSAAAPTTTSDVYSYGTTSVAATTSDVYGYGTTSTAAPTSDVYGYGTTSAAAPATTSDVYGYGVPTQVPQAHPVNLPVTPTAPVYDPSALTQSLPTATPAALPVSVPPSNPVQTQLPTAYDPTAALNAHAATPPVQTAATLPVPGTSYQSLEAADELTSHTLTSPEIQERKPDTPAGAGVESAVAPSATVSNPPRPPTAAAAQAPKPTCTSQPAAGYY